MLGRVELVDRTFDPMTLLAHRALGGQPCSRGCGRKRGNAGWYILG